MLLGRADARAAKRRHDHTMSPTTLRLLLLPALAHAFSASSCGAAAPPSPSVLSALPPSPAIATPHTLSKVVYGKYFSYDADGGVSTEANTYYVYMPTTATEAGAKVPIVVEYHGGGFTGGSATSSLTARIESYLSNGVAYASMDYRLVATKYYYHGAGATACEEEFIHADGSGRLRLDTAGMVSSDYKVRVGRQEFNTKCSFDAAAGFDDLLNRSASLGIDVHRIGLTGGSAGGGEIHYLSWVYRTLDRNWERYTPVAMVYTYLL